MIFLLIVILLVLILGIRYYVKVHSPEYKGKIGESIVARYLNKLPEDKYKIFNNIYLKVGNGSVQIDHFIVSIYGIFVIETKNYSGWIFGSENQNYWTQIVFKTKTKFINPIQQNNSHINSLKYILSNYEYIKYFSIIIFTGSAELKSINSSTPVIYENQLYNYILRSEEEQNLNSEQMNSIISILNENIIQEKDIEKKHIQNIKKNIHERRHKINSLICPKCGGSLVIRSGNHGEFYGCSNYPNCKFTSNI